MYCENLFNQIYHQNRLYEEIRNGYAIVYHRSKEEDYYKYFFNKELKFGTNMGLLDGAGIYCTYDIKSQMNKRMIMLYGEYIHKFRCPTENLFIFDYEELIKQNWVIKYNRLHPDNPINEHNFIDVQFKKFGFSKEGFDIIDRDTIQKDLGALGSYNIPNYSGLLSSKNAHKFSEWVMQNYANNDSGLHTKCNGITFVGKADGKVAVIWKSYSLIPLEYAHSKKWDSEISEIKWKKVPGLTDKLKDYQNTYITDTELSKVNAGINGFINYDRLRKLDKKYDILENGKRGMFENYNQLKYELDMPRCDNIANTIKKRGDREFLASYKKIRRIRGSQLEYLKQAFPKIEEIELIWWLKLDQLDYLDDIESLKKIKTLQVRIHQKDLPEFEDYDFSDIIKRFNVEKLELDVDGFRPVKDRKAAKVKYNDMIKEYGVESYVSFF